MPATADPGGVEGGDRNVADADLTGRAIIYAIRASDRVENSTLFALQALRTVGSQIVLIHPGAMRSETRTMLDGLADVIVEMQDQEFTTESYREGIDRARKIQDVSELILTGDSWFGPVGDIHLLFDEMEGNDADFWDVIPPSPPREAFPGEGFEPIPDRPWFFTVVRRRLFDSRAWADWWAEPAEPGDRERSFGPSMQARGFTHARAFETAQLHADDPGLFAPEDLLDAGVPFVDRAVFSSYPPFLDRFAILGQEIAELMRRRGYPLDLLLSSLASSVPPKALNTNLGLLSVLSDTAVDSNSGASMSIAAVVHVSDMDEIDEILRRLQFLPSGASVFLTITEGVTAARLERLLESWAAANGYSYELRVTPQSPGRDMADFFVACRDVIQPGRFDLVVKVHMRRAPWKTMNRLRYFRRYQFDNLLSSPGYVRNLLSLFESQPQLGVVFPPMIHVGYATMGRGWAMLHSHAQRLAARLKITVPLDVVSPLAPYGGMWVGRPEAFQALSRHPWTFSDYGWKSERRYGHLPHLQERMLSAAAGQSGYYCRTVMNHTHAEIGYTALEYKVDQMFSTTRGWPVEQIGFLHRAGYTGYGGTVALIRMYVRTNHPRVAETFRPAYRLALRGHRVLAGLRRAASRLRRARPEEEREVAS